MRHILVAVGLVASLSAQAQEAETDAPFVGPPESPPEEPSEEGSEAESESDPRDEQIKALTEALNAQSARLDRLEKDGDQEKLRKRKLLDGLQLSFGGMVQYDLRIRPTSYAPNQFGHYFNEVANPDTLSRNELITRFKLGARLGRFGIKTNLDFVVRAYPNATEIGDLSDFNKVSPFRFEAHDAYIYANDLFPGFDVAIGQQTLMFGVGDQFNPTNTTNPLDLEDILLFGDRLGNLMVRLDYRPRWNWEMTGVLIPIFKPALLPRTGYLAQTPDRYPYDDAQTRWNFNVEQAVAEQTLTEVSAGDTGGTLNLSPLGLGKYPTIVRNISVRTPETNAENMMGFFRLAASFGSQDIALSYFRGFNDIPMPVQTDTYQVNELRCANPGDADLPPEERSGDCVDGVLANDVVLSYPRMHVLGLNWAGEAVIGYRFELGIFFPEGAVSNPVDQHNIVFGSGLISSTQDGPYQFRNGTAAQVLDTRPFAKWTLGIDYTFNEHVYLNAQWVHGFPDEFGAGDWIQSGDTVRASSLRDGAQGADCVSVDLAGGFARTIDGRKCAREWLKPKLGDYLVLGLDFKFAAQRGLFRLFTIWDLIGVYEETWDPDAGQRTRTWHHMFTSEGFGAVLYPDFRWNFGNGLEMHAGALIQLGQKWGKFGAPETGGHQVWTRARYSF